jgi:prevent-host-death family protein
MLTIENIRSLTDFRRHSKDYVEQLQVSKLPMVLTVNGEAAIVVQDAKAFQEIQNKIAQLEQELQRLKLEALKHDIQIGIDQIEAGQYTTYTEQSAGDLVEQIKAKGRARKAQA